MFYVREQETSLNSLEPGETRIGPKGMCPRLMDASVLDYC